MADAGKDWVCVGCGEPLGKVLGSEFHPSITSSNLSTSGSNLRVVCPECGQVKIWYSSSPVDRAINQLINVISEEAARAMISQMGKFIHTGQ